MYRYAKKYSKKIMTVLSIVLMVIFIISQANSVNTHDATNPVLGRIGETDILNSDLQQSEAEWAMLADKACVFANVPPRYPGMPAQPQYVPIIYSIGSSLSGGDVAVGQRIVAQIRNTPELYLLLKREAQQMGIQISVDRFESALRNEVRVRTSDDQLKPVADLDPNLRDTQMLRQSILDFMMIQSAFERAASTIKVSQPLRQHTVAEQFQRLSVDLIEFPAGDYASKVAPPTTQQADEQFKTYANVVPGLPDKTNPHGFGYRYPDRVKFQYIQVPRADLIKAADAKRNKDDQSRYDWKKDAFIYYDKNQNLFATTQPSSQPSLLLQAKGPTTRPFEEVVDRAEQLVVQNDADKLAAAIEARITAILNDDYTTYARAVGSATTTAPVGAPTSTVGPPIIRYEYLQKLALEIQKEFGVLPQTTARDKDFQSETELTALPGIGGAYYKSIDFSRYAIGYAQPLLGDQQSRPEAQNLNLWEPSQPLHDDHSDLYFFRLTDAQKAHAPDDKSEVLAQIQSDLRDVGAYTLAEADAKRFLESIKIPSTLFTAAGSAGKKLIHAGPFSFDQPPQNYPLSPPSAMTKFVQDTYDMLSLVTPAGTHPIKQIDLPSGKRVVVAQLVDILPLWRPGGLPVAEWQVDTGLFNSLRRQFAFEWFDYEGVVSRLNYHEENPASNKHRRGAPRPSPDQSTPPPVDPLSVVPFPS